MAEFTVNYHTNVYFMNLIMTGTLTSKVTQFNASIFRVKLTFQISVKVEMQIHLFSNFEIITLWY
jgi:hypothetical protein